MRDGSPSLPPPFFALAAGKFALGPYLRSPSKPPALSSTSAWRASGIVGDGELGLAQALDLVAQARGRLELEVGGGLAHAPLQVLDDGREVVADERRLLGEAGVDRHVVLLVDARPSRRGCCA